MENSAQPRRFTRFKLATNIASLLVIFFGCCGLFGWLLGGRPNSTGVVDLPWMVPNSALGFILAGAALWLLQRDSNRGVVRRCGYGIAIAVAALGAITVLEYALSWDPGIDLLLFKNTVLRRHNVLPGRPAILTAASFSLLGIGLLCLNWRMRSGRKPAEFLAVTAILISLLGLIGHVFNVSSFYSWRTLFPESGMALSSVLAFVLLGTGLLCARPSGGLMEIITSRNASGTMARRLLLAPVIIPLVTGWIRVISASFGIHNEPLIGWWFAFANISVFTFFIWWSARLIFSAETRQKGAEDNLQLLNVRLEQRVHERTLELSQTLQALHNSEQRVRAVLDSALDAVITADARGIITTWNKEAERMFGWTAAEIVGHNLSSTIIPPGYRQRHEDGLKRFIKTGEGPVLNQRIEITALTRSGIEFPVELAITPIRLGDHVIFSAFVRDISKRKRAEESLQAMLKEVNDLKAALDEHAIVAITDPRGRITYVNEKFCSISKYSREELLGQDHRIINSGYHSKEFIRGLWTTIARGHVWKGEIRNRAKDGTFYWVDTTIVPFLDASGKPIQYVAIRADITDRKRVEDNLRQSEARFRTMADRTPAMIWMSGTEKLWTWFNQVWLDFVGRPMEQELGNGWADNVHPEDFERCLDVYVSSFDARRPFDMEYRLKRHDGVYRWILDHGVPLLGIHGEFVGYIGSCVDVTERKEVLETVNRLNSDLEQRVRNRTLQLQESNKELEAFSYSVSHDLRAPLRHIAGFVEMLREELQPVLNDSARHQLGVITDSAERMGTLIDNLLTFSRMGRAEVRHEPVDMNALTREVLEDLASEMKGRRITWQIEDMPDVFGDRVLLKQVWFNLLSNAVKYTRQRDVAEIQIGSQHQDETVEFFVKDNGAGFNMKYVNKLFGVFQRLHLADEFEGTGIGLANVRRIIARHGGRVRAEGNPNAGATFYFTLPCISHPKHEPQPCQT